MNPYQDTAHTLIVLDGKGRPVFSRQVSMKKQSFCCPDADPPAPCTVGYSNVQAWGNNQVVFVTGGCRGNPDGCEIDKKYLIIWPAEHKAHLEKNE